MASSRVVQGPGHLGPSASSIGTRQVCGVRAWLRAGAVGAEQGVEAGGQIQVSGRPGLQDTGRLGLSRLPSTGLPPSQHAAPAWPGWDGAATSVARPVLGCVTLGCSLTSLSPPMRSSTGRPHVVAPWIDPNGTRQRSFTPPWSSFLTLRGLVQKVLLETSRAQDLGRRSCPTQEPTAFPTGKSPPDGPRPIPTGPGCPGGPRA